MDIYAAGFNAWNQLNFEPLLGDDDEPRDLSTFTKVLTDDHLERPRAGLHYTLVRGRTRYYCAGTGFESASDEELQHTHDTCQANNGLTLALDHPQASARKRDGSSEPPNHHVLTLYPSFEDFKSKSNPTSWTSDSLVREVAAFDAGFLILYEDGTVATMGDPRYQDCLAREAVSADEPGFVPDLLNLGDPIKHVAAGGYCLAALTQSGSIYIWGRRVAKQRLTGHSAFPDLCDMPNYCEVDQDKDIQDMALGDSHAIALATDNTVYVIGRNQNGQLGLGQGSNIDAASWTKVDLAIADGQQVVGVAAGPRSSFILTALKTHAT